MRAILGALLLSVLVHVVHAADTLTLSKPWDRVVVQRGRDNTGLIPIAGSCSSAAATVEARATAGTSGTTVDWTVIASPNATAFSGSLRLVGGGWYALEVRAKNASGGVLASATIARVGVGEVFFMAGQSNILGANASTAASQDRAVKVVYTAENTPASPTAFIQMSAAMPGSPGGFLSVNSMGPTSGGATGPAGTMADLLVQDQNVPVLCFQAAKGGSAVGEWLTNARNDSLGSVSYGNLIKAMQTFLPITGGARAVLWHQGEADTATSIATTPLIYADRLNELAGLVRTKVGIADLPFVTARVSALVGGEVPGQLDLNVESGHSEAVKLHPLMFAGPLTDDLQRSSTSDVHYNATGQTEHGRRWFQRLKTAFFSTPVVCVSLVDATASEGGTDSAAVKLWRTGPTTSALAVTLALSGRAVASDYTLSGSGVAGTTVTIPAGAATATVTIAGVDDATAEGDETLVVAVASGTGYAIKQVDPAIASPLGGTSGAVNAGDRATIVIAASDGGTVEVMAAADAAVDSTGGKDATGATLVVGDNDSKKTNSFLKFPLTGLSAPIVGAKLRVYLTSGNFDLGDSDHQIDLVASDAWTEAAITWAAQPAVGSRLSAFAANRSGFIDLDVTDQVAARISAGGTVVSFRLCQTWKRPYSSASYASSSNATVANRPRLVLTTSAAAAGAEVRGLGVPIATGDTSPATSDDTDWGARVVGAAATSHTFTIANTGSAALTIGTVTVSGTHAVDFVRSVPAASSIAVGASTTFAIAFTPGAVGARTATVSFTTNDPSRPTYAFAISGTGQAAAAPVIAVSGNGVSIANGDTSPTGTDHTDAGTAEISGGTVVRTFTIANSGSAALTLGSVTFSGAAAADFQATLAAASVAAGATTTLTVTFDPSAVGLRAATIAIPSNDSARSPYSFALSGTGLDSVPEIELRQQGSPTVIISGSPASTADGTDFGDRVIGSALTRTFAIHNLGAADLNLTGIQRVVIGGPAAADVQVTQPASGVVVAGANQTFTVTVTPSVAGVRTATLTIASNDADESSHVLNLRVNGTTTSGPTIAVSGNAVAIANGDTTPSTADHTAFGSTAVAGGQISRTFRIDNSGTSTLTLGSVTVSPTTDYAITTAPAASVAAGGFTTVIVRFDPTVVGVRNATLSIPSNDSAQSTFTFAISGTGTTPPEIAVEGLSGLNVPSGGGPSGATGTDFTVLTVGATSATRTFTIRNLGGSDLLLSGTPALAIGGAQAGDYTISQPAGGIIAAGATQTFTVAVTPAAVGARLATVTIANNDADEGAFVVNLKVVGKEPVTASALATGGDSGGGCGGGSGLAVILALGCLAAGFVRPGDRRR